MHVVVCGICVCLHVPSRYIIDLPTNCLMEYKQYFFKEIKKRKEKSAYKLAFPLNFYVTCKRSMHNIINFFLPSPSSPFFSFSSHFLFSDLSAYFTRSNDILNSSCFISAKKNYCYCFSYAYPSHYPFFSLKFSPNITKF